MVLWRSIGRLAQLGERCVRIAEVESSNLLSSTILEPESAYLQAFPVFYLTEYLP